MLRYDAAFIEREPLLRMLSGEGQRKDNEWKLVYVHLPGYKASIMNPNFERFASFGNWGMECWKQMPTTPIDPKRWFAVLELRYTEFSWHVVTARLDAFVKAKTMYEWYDYCQSIRQGKAPNPLYE